MAKAKIQYKVRVAADPQHEGQTILRPVIVNTRQLDLEAFVESAVAEGYFGNTKYQQALGMVNSVFEAINKMVLDGFLVKCAKWVSFYPVLTGSVDETRELTSENRLLLRGRICSDMSVSADDFSFEQVDKPEKLTKVTGIASDGYTSPIIKKNVAFNAYGKYMAYDAALGDSVTVEYEGLATPLTLTPTASDYQHMAFAFPSALAEVGDGTLLTFTFTTHPEGAEGAAQVNTFTGVFAE